MSQHKGIAVLTFVLLTVAASMAQSSAVQPRITQAVDERMIQIEGNVHPLARPEFDRGALPDSQPLDRILLVLQRSVDQETALRQLLDEQQTRTSPNYHAWLTPEQFGQQFGPADADIQVVTSWLASQGFQGINVSKGKTVVEFTGTAGQARAAFRTEIHKFVINGQEHNANVSDPQIPAALAPVVAGVVSLHNFPQKSYSHFLGTFRRTKATGEVSPLFTFPVGHGFLLGVGPTDFATIYNVLPLWQAGIDGTGQTIAIVGDSNINPSDVQDYRTMFGLPTNNPFNTPQVIVNGPDPGLNADEGEAALDVQVAGGVAKNAQIILVATEQPFTAGVAGVDLSALFIIDNNLAPVLSKSFGGCEADFGTTYNKFQNGLWQQAVAQGITPIVAAGDSGSAGCDSPFTELVAAQGLAVSGAASTPFDVAVGGTDFDSSLPNYGPTYWNQNNAAGSQASAKSYIPEIPWNDTCAASGSTTACTATVINNDAQILPGLDLSAGSGGLSAVYTKPSWQAGTGVPADGKRDLPDLSLFSGNGLNGSFYIICQQDANAASGGSPSSCDLNSPYLDFQGAGGTSASAQTFAGIMALVNQYQASHGGSGRQGNVNYVLYPMAAKSGASCASNPAAVSATGCVFYDLPAGAGNNSVACQGGSPDCSNTSKSANQFGIMTTATGGSTPAYNATTGYDLASGLGSVNANNLITKWAAASFSPSMTSFTLNGGSAVNITHGAAVTVSGTVQPQSGGGTPTGIVELMQGSTFPGPVIDTFTLVNGSYSGSTQMLPGSGTPYQVFAHYGGDGTFAASDSATQMVNSVAKENSVVTVSLVTFPPPSGNPVLTTAPTTLQYGAAYVLRVDVTNSADQPCSNSTPPTIPCPTGTVTLLDNGQPLKDFLVPNTSTPTDTAQLNNFGFAEDQPIQLPASTTVQNITASYGGDNSYNAQPNSNTLALTINKATTTTTVTVTPSTGVTTATPLNINATIATTSDSLTGPTGTVIFFNNGVQIPGTLAVTTIPATATTPASAFAGEGGLSLPAGNASITAQYSGDQNYAASQTTAAVTFSVAQGGSFSASGSGATATAGGANGTSTITLNPSGGFMGQVQVTCPAVTLPPGVTCSPNPLIINVTSSSEVTGQLTVAVAGPSAPGTTAEYRPATRIEYASLQKRPTRNGWWKLSAGTGLSAIFLFFLPGRRRYRTILGLWLVCVLSFVMGCGGGGSGGGIVATPTTTKITAPVTKAPSGTALTFNVAITATSSGMPAGNGMVQLFDGVTGGSQVQAVNGVATFTNVTSLSVGTHAISARYLGDASTQASQSGAVFVTVTGNTTVGIATNPASSNNNVLFALTIN